MWLSIYLLFLYKSDMRISCAKITRENVGIFKLKDGMFHIITRSFLKGTVVNWASTSLNGGCLEIRMCDLKLQ